MDPTAAGGVSSWHSGAVFKMIDPDLALRLVLEHTPPGRVADVPLGQASGLTLVETASADRDYPPFHRAAMDGYAVRVGDAGRPVAVAGEVAAGHEASAPVREGQAVEIMTGAPCPPGTEAVVKREDVRVLDGRVALPPAIAFGENISPRGCERPRGAAVAPAGTVVTPLTAAVLATVGVTRARVHARPTLAIVTTGDELVVAGRAPGAAQIRDSNGPMLVALAEALGLAPPDVQHASDTRASLLEALTAAGRADLVLLSGGVSAGKYDLVPDVLAGLGAEMILHKVTQKPGKPMLVARRGTQMIFGLPGNPLSTHLCFHRYVAPAARKMMGRPAVEPPDHGRLARPLGVASDRTLFLLARVEPGEDGWQVTALPGRGSADVFASVGANAYVRLAAGAHRLEAGTAVEFEWIAERR